MNLHYSVILVFWVENLRPYWIDVQTNINDPLNFHLIGGGGGVSFKKLGNCKSPTGVILFKVKHFYKIKLNPFLHTLS